jgi:hypothetical protein
MSIIRAMTKFKRFFLRTWVHICPRCKKQVKRKSRECPYCGEKYPFAVKVPLGLVDNLDSYKGKAALGNYVHAHYFSRVSESVRLYLQRYFTILRVQGNARGTTSDSSSSLSVTMASAPTNGNLLILCIGLNDGSVTSIIQTGVNWSTGGAGLQQSENASGAYTAEIYAGIVGSGASTSITINVSPSSYAVADVCEYSGLALSGFLDKTATSYTAGYTTTTHTGTTATTTQANELWIGVTVEYGAQSAPTNGFTLLDGASYDGSICI